MKDVRRIGLSVVAVLSSLVVLLAISGPASAETVPSLGPLELFEGSGASIVSPSLLSFGQVVAPPTGAGFGRPTGAAARTQVSEIKITKPVDVATPRLFSATATGKHFKKATIEVFKAGSPVSVCLEDAFLASDRVSASASDGPSTEEVQIAYAKEKLVYGGGCDSSGGRVPSALAVLTGLGPGAATIGARVDCLTKRCRGSLSVELPGGTSSGSGRFSMGDGSVRTLALAVPNGSRAFLRAHPATKLKTLLALNGGGSPLVGHDLLTPVASKIEGLPSLSVAPGAPPSGGPIPTPTPTPTPPPTPTPLAQSLAIDGCATTVVGTPTLITVNGSLSPARGGVAVALEYVPTSGPAPFPAPVTDVVPTDAAGHFAESFDRRREGRDYSWTVTASTGEGGGYMAARSSACAIPIP